MCMPDLARRWTRDEVLALPDDGKRYELLDGELLVSPSPSLVHQRAVLALYNRLHPYVDPAGFGEVGLAPADIDLLSGQYLQPDLFVGATPSSPRGDWSDFSIPLLVVEVLSPSTAFHDRNRKRPRYLEAGVAEYWIVDTDARLIECWRRGDERPEILTDRIEWQPVASREPLVVELPAYFSEVWRERSAP